MTSTAFFASFACSLSIAGLALACDGSPAKEAEPSPSAAKVGEATPTTKTTTPTAAAIRGAESEAKQYLRRIADAAHAARTEAPSGDSLSLTPEPMAYPPSVKMTPALGSCCASGGQCTSTAATWKSAGWDKLDFAIEDPHFFSYSYEVLGDGDSFLATASGDPDCDGMVDVYEISGSFAGDSPKTSAVKKRE